MNKTHKTLTLRLEHTPNPDIRGGYWEAPIDEPREIVEVPSLADARRRFRDWIERNGLGGGNMTKNSGQVHDGETLVGRFSYNGRYWLPNGEEGRI